MEGLAVGAAIIAPVLAKFAARIVDVAAGIAHVAPVAIALCVAQVARVAPQVTGALANFAGALRGGGDGYRKGRQGNACSNCRDEELAHDISFFPGSKLVGTGPTGLVTASCPSAPECPGNIACSFES